MSLLTLPAELHLQIADELFSALGSEDYTNFVKDLSSLHRTNKYFKSLLDQPLSTQGLLAAHKSSPETYTSRLTRFLSSGARITAVDPVEGVVTRRSRVYKVGCRTALHHAAATGNTAAARILLLGGLFVDVLPASLDIRETPLVIAIRNVDVKMVEVLLSHGANVEKIANYHLWGNCGHTPLGHAILCHSVPIIKLLLKYGADPNAPVKANDSIPPLYVAVNTYQIDCVKVLLEHGADAKWAFPGTGETLVRIFGKGRLYYEIVQLLMDFGGTFEGET